MSKVTSRLRVAIPKALAMRYGIRPGDEARWEATGRGPLLVAGAAIRPDLTPSERLASLREFLGRHAVRQRGKKWRGTENRGWTREDLYEGRGLAR